MFARRVFLVAPSFHGATLLARLLDAHPAVASLGDTYPGNKYDQLCGCGARVSACPYWRAIKSAVKAERYAQEASMLPFVPKVLGGRADWELFRVLPISMMKHLIPAHRLRTFADDYERFLGAVHALSAPKRPSVFVDGVKSVGRVKAMLCMGEPVDGVIHLRRNPEDFAKSSAKGKGRALSHAIVARSALKWRTKHRDFGKLARGAPYLGVRYEDLCSTPDKILSEVFAFLGVAPMTVDELRQQNREPWHFMGNSSVMRFAWQLHAHSYPVSRFEHLLIRTFAGAASSPA